MSNEKRVVKEVVEKRERGTQLTKRKERVLAYSPYGTTCSSFASVNATH